MNLSPAFTHALGAVSNPSADNCSDDFSWGDFLTKLFPNDTAAWVASFTRTTVRAAEHVLSGRNRLGGTALINLLRSPVGPRVLDALAGNTEWRAVELRLLAIYELEQELQNLEHKRRELARSIEGSRR